MVTRFTGSKDGLRRMDDTLSCGERQTALRRTCYPSRLVPVRRFTNMAAEQSRFTTAQFISRTMQISGYGGSRRAERRRRLLRKESCVMPTLFLIKLAIG